jgi:hypothetical protein
LTKMAKVYLCHNRLESSVMRIKWKQRTR